MRRSFPAMMVWVVSLVLASSALADVKLPHVLSDHMVLQQEAPIPIWGTAQPGESVSVTLGEQKATAAAAASGRWSVRLEPLKAGGPLEMTVSGKNTLKVTDILVGEVWLASGQSNMVWWVKTSKDADKEIAAADHPSIRMFTVGNAVAGKPMSDVPGQWQVCSSKTVPDFSAVAYFFGRELHKAMNVPVGLINSSWGGTPAESWASRAALLGNPALRIMVERWDKIVADYQKARAYYHTPVAVWIDDSIAAENSGRRVTPAPKTAGDDPRLNPWRASGLYNAMIAPVIPFAIKGAIWYQGESNAARAYQYRTLFPAMIQDWRQAWGQGDFPFLFVQLANFATKAPQDGTWAELREAQTMTLSLEKTGMAVAVDIGDPANIHPANKQEVGRRLALAAQAIAYGKQVEWYGPMYDSMAIDGDQVRIKFGHAQGLRTQDGRPARELVIAGEDRKFVEAQATIEGDTLVVSSPAVAKPAAVRYGWNDCPTCTLINAAGLPASPFRTDDWPGLTVDAK